MTDGNHRMDDITKAIHELAISATPDRRRSKRVRYIKAKNKIEKDQKLKDNNDQKENINNIATNHKKKKQKLKIKPKLKTIKETEIEQKEIFIDKNKNDCVFPQFKTINYKYISDDYNISIPSYLAEWLTKLLSMINNCSINDCVDSFEWMVLLYPSLILIIKNTKNKQLINLINKTLQIFRDLMLNEIEMYSPNIVLNDLLICIELFSDNISAIPRDIWNYFNKLCESTNTFNKFLNISCARSKDIKLVKELLNCNQNELIKKKSIYSSVRSKWESFIGVYTQIVRLHRLYKVNFDKLTPLARINIIKLCDVFDNKYSFILRSLLSPLKQRSDKLKIDYSYFRYKTMAMCTHTATSIPPAFAGYYGYINDDDDDGQEIDATSWKIVIDALEIDVNNFIKTVNIIINQNKNKNKKCKSLLNIINKMAKKETQQLRILDNICYNSVCAMIMYNSLKNNTNNEINLYYNKLIKMRKKIKNIIHKLSTNSLLFCQNIVALDKDILHSCFLTYDKEGKKVWSVHLMSGILLNFWGEN